MQKFLKNLTLYILILVLFVLLFQNYPIFKRVEPIKFDFDTFVQKVKNHEIASVTLRDRDNVMEGTLKNKKKFTVAYPKDYEITKVLLANKVRFEINPQTGFNWIELVVSIIPVVLVFAIIWFFMFQQLQGGSKKVLSFGKSRAKRMAKDQPRVTFKDVAGLDEAVEELEEIREYLATPGKFQAIGAKIPKGVLLYGPPGAGKTLLARAVAGEAGVPFFSISGSDFVEMFVGVGASRVRDLFEQAKANEPCIIFMDEIDAVGRHRGAGLGGGHDEREQTLNQLLVEMDGFDVKDSVILIAATNRPDILDPALLRPGRFDRQIVIDRPDLRGRGEILKIHTRGKPLAKGVDLEVLARRTPGFTGADLANLVNEAALLTARHSKKEIDMSELEEATDRVLAGPERKSRLISDREKEIIAYHETGHALVGHILPRTDPIHKISIIPRGMALGYTLSLPTEDKYLVTKSELTDELAMLLGGRVSEELIFNEVTTGDQNDLDRATKIARKMVCEYGMSEKLGPLTLGQKQDLVFLGRDFASHPDYSPEIAFEIDQEIRRMVDEAFHKARQILTKNRAKLDMIAKLLIEKETLEKDELEELLEGDPVKLAAKIATVTKIKLKDKLETAEVETVEKKVKPKKVPPKLRPAES